MPEQQGGYTYEELVKAGAKPGGYTLEELQKAGAKPGDEKSPLPQQIQDILARQKAQYPSDQEKAMGAVAPQPQLPARPQDDARSGMQMAQDLGADFVRGIPQAITSVPSMMGGLFKSLTDPTGVMATQQVGSMMHGIVDPMKTMGRNAAALADSLPGMMPTSPTSMLLGGKTSAPQPPTPQENSDAAQFGGATVGNMMLGAGLKGMSDFKSPELSNKFQDMANVNTAKSLRPTTLEGQAVTQQLAPEMSARGIRGTGNQIDAQLVDGLDKSTAKLEEVQKRLENDPRPEMDIPMRPLISKIDGAIDKLKIKGTDRAVNQAAVNALQEVKADFQAIDNEGYAKFGQVLDLRQKLDAAVDDAGGFAQSTNAADRIAMRAKRGGADIARMALNGADPELAAANKDYAFHRHTVDIVQRRQLGDVGKTGNGLPGRGSILDDVLAGWAGEAIGGHPGAVAAEMLNLARQTRAWSSIKGGIQQGLADALRPPMPAPRALLPQTAGAPYAMPSSGNAEPFSQMTVTTGPPLMNSDPYAAARGSKPSVMLGPNETMPPTRNVNDPYAAPLGAKPSVAPKPAVQSSTHVIFDSDGMGGRIPVAIVETSTGKVIKMLNK